MIVSELAIGPRRQIQLIIFHIVLIVDQNDRASARMRPIPEARVVGFHRAHAPHNAVVLRISHLQERGQIVIGIVGRSILKQVEQRLDQIVLVLVDRVVVDDGGEDLFAGHRLLERSVQIAVGYGEYEPLIRVLVHFNVRIGVIVIQVVQRVGAVLLRHFKLNVVEAQKQMLPVG